MPAKKKPVTRVVAIRIPYAVHKAFADWVAARPARKRKIGQRVLAAVKKSEPDLPWDVETWAEEIEKPEATPQTEPPAPEAVTPE